MERRRARLDRVLVERRRPGRQRGAVFVQHLKGAVHETHLRVVLEHSETPGEAVRQIGVVRVEPGDVAPPRGSEARVAVLGDPKRSRMAPVVNAGVVELLD